MTRKRCNRRTVTPTLPPGLRPKLKRDQVRDLAIVHHSNLDDMVKGRGTVDLLWQITGGVLTWSYVAQQLRRDIEKSVTRALCNVRMVPVLNIGGHQKIAEVRVSDA